MSTTLNYSGLSKNVFFPMQNADMSGFCRINNQILLVDGWVTTVEKPLLFDKTLHMRGRVSSEGSMGVI